MAPEQTIIIFLSLWYFSISLQSFFNQLVFIFFVFELMMDEDPINPRYLPLQRFEKVELLETHVKEPKDFDIDEFIHKNNLSYAYSDDLYTFEAIFDKTMAFHLLETPLNSSQEITELKGNKLLVKARMPDTLQFEQWLMSFGSDVEVLKPKKLRNKFISLTKKMRSMYQ